MTIEQKRRELFEAWFDSRAFSSSLDVVSAWMGFNAALDAVVIELPSCFETFGPYSQDAARIATECCAEAIESTNLGLKVLP